MTETPEFNAYGVKTHHTKAMGGGTFETTLYPAGEAIDLMPFLIAISSGPAGIITDVLRSMVSMGDLMAGDTSGREVREGLLSLSEQIVKHGGSAKLKEILAHTRYQHPGDAAIAHCGQHMDTVFQGRVGLLIQVVAWVLEVNYAPFSKDGQSQWGMARLTQLAGKSQGVLGKWLRDLTSPPESGSGSESSTKKASNPE